MGGWVVIIDIVMALMCALAAPRSLSRLHAHSSGAGWSLPAHALFQFRELTPIVTARQLTMMREARGRMEGRP